jgi:hypothetical protein
MGEHQAVGNLVDPRQAGTFGLVQLLDGVARVAGGEQDPQMAGRVERGQQQQLPGARRHPADP